MAEIVDRAAPLFEPCLIQIREEEYLGGAVAQAAAAPGVEDAFLACISLREALVEDKEHIVA